MKAGAVGSIDSTQADLTAVSVAHCLPRASEEPGRFGQYVGHELPETGGTDRDVVGLGVGRERTSGDVRALAGRRLLG